MVDGGIADRPRLGNGLGCGMAARFDRVSALARPVSAPAMPEAPNNMKQPITTVMPRRNSIRPESISSPITAIAMTAIAVAVDPNATPCTHSTPSAIGLSAGGSVSDVVGEYIRDPLDAFSMGLKHDGERRTSFHRGAMVQFQLGSLAQCALSPFCRLSQTIPIGAQGGLVRLTTKIAGWAGSVAGLFHAATAQAQELADPEGSGVLVSAVQWLQGTLLGTVATVVAVIAVATVGFMMLTGRINWRYGVTVILGCFILFGAASIVAGIQSTASLGR